MQDYLCGCIGGIWGTLTSYPIDTLREDYRVELNQIEVCIVVLFHQC